MHPTMDVLCEPLHGQSVRMPMCLQAADVVRTYNQEYNTSTKLMREKSSASMITVENMNEWMPKFWPI